MRGNSRTGFIAAIVAAVMLVAVAAAGACAFSGGFDLWGRDGGSSTAPDDESPGSVPDISSGGSDDPDAGSSSSSEGSSSGDGGFALPILPGDDNGDGSGPGDSGDDSAASTDIYGPPGVSGFYTGDVSVGFGHHPDQGRKVSGSDLQAGSSYAISVEANVTDRGLQWYKDGAVPVNSNNDPTDPVKGWMAVDTSVGMILEIHSDRPIGADEVSVASVWGKALAVGDPRGNGPGLRSVEQVDPNTLRIFLVSEPYAATSWAGAFQSPISLASSNGSVENFTDKGSLAAYAPLKIHFSTPGDYDLSFYLAKFDSSGHIEREASPATTVPVSVSAKA